MSEHPGKQLSFCVSVRECACGYMHEFVSVCAVRVCSLQSFAEELMYLSSNILSNQLRVGTEP